MKNLVLSDIDGTLIKGSLILNHAVYLNNKGIIDLGTLPKDWLKNKKNEDLVGQLSTKYRTAVTGLKPKELLINSFVRELLSDKENFYDSFNLLDLMKSDSEIILVSGSPDYLVNPFAKILGYKQASSTYYRDKEGRLNGEIKPMYTSEAKRSFTKTINREKYNSIIALGDTLSDKPLFDISNIQYLVNPNENVYEVIVKSHPLVQIIKD